MIRAVYFFFLRVAGLYFAFARSYNRLSIFYNRQSRLEPKSISRIIWIIEVPSREILPKLLTAISIFSNISVPSIFVQKHRFCFLNKKLLAGSLVVSKSATYACSYHLFYAKRNGATVLLIPEELCSYSAAHSASIIDSSINKLSSRFLDYSITNLSSLVSDRLSALKVSPIDCFNPRLTYCKPSLALAKMCSSVTSSATKPHLLLILSTGILNSKYGIDGEALIARNVYPDLSRTKIQTMIDNCISEDILQYSCYQDILCSFKSLAAQLGFSILIRPHPNESYDKVAEYLGPSATYLSDPAVPFSSLLSNTFLALTYNCTTSAECYLADIPVVDLASLHNSSLEPFVSRVISVISSARDTSPTRCLPNLSVLREITFSGLQPFLQSEGDSLEWLKEAKNGCNNLSDYISAHFTIEPSAKNSIQTISELCTSDAFNDTSIPYAAAATWSCQNYVFPLVPEYLRSLGLVKIDQYTYLLER